MLLHDISISDVHPGDHLYQWQKLKMLQGIAVPHISHESKICVVTSYNLTSFCLVTLENFVGNGVLRRARYDQGEHYLHWIKLPGTSFSEHKRPPEEIVENAFLLLKIANTNLQLIKKLCVHGIRDFAKLCCTMSHETLRMNLLRNGEALLQQSLSSQLVEKKRIEELEDKIKILEDQRACRICMERPNEVAFLCGHLTCFQCSQLITQCHICRTPIHQKIKLFLY